MAFESEIFTTTCCACNLNFQYPFSIFLLADAALIAAGSSGKKETSEAGAAFLRVQEAMEQFGSPPPRKDLDDPGNHRKKLPDPRTALATASLKDAHSTRGFLSKIIKSKSAAPVSCLSKSNHSTAHDTVPGTTQGTHNESKLRYSQIAAWAQ
jgi:hypothetical protein